MKQDNVYSQISPGVNEYFSGSHLNHDAIPIELRALKQWCLWCNEPNGKVPYQPNGKHCDVTKRSHYATFAEVVAIATRYEGVGIGFIFTESDPYCGIDLDYSTDQVIIERQTKIYTEFNSYSERSVSRKGCHIIIKAKLQSGRRRDKVELYPHSRFFAMTGDVCNAVPIAERQELADILWGEMGSQKQQSTYVNEIDEKFTDAEIISWALNAENGEKFQSLWEGHWQDLYTSQSEADFALIDIIAYYTRSRNQVWRLFLKSTLGKRKKAQRADYIEYMLNRAYDNQPPPVIVDYSGNPFADLLKKGEAK